jgi:LacI family transcriptional regulator
LASRRVDGIILLPATQGTEYVHWLKSLEVPVVTTGNPLHGIHHVSIDDFSAAHDTTQYISRKGYRHICFICPPLRKKNSQGGKYNLKSQDLRAQGFLQYMKQNPKLKYEVLMEKNYYDTAASMVRSAKEKIAFFCSSDVFALELLKSFREQGISFPKDAGLMGFDNLDILTYISPLISTVSVPLETQGREVLNVLFELIAGKTMPKSIYIPHVICPGETI